MVDDKKNIYDKNRKSIFIQCIYNLNNMCLFKLQKYIRGHMSIAWLIVHLLGNEKKKLI